MSEFFRDDFFWMLREAKGYFPWVQERPYRLARHLRLRHRRHCPMCDDSVLFQADQEKKGVGC